MSDYTFSFGPWNIHEGSDPFGPPVRPSIEFAEKVKLFKGMGFDAIMLHDDDAVPDIDSKGASELESEANALRVMLENEGLVTEICAPRLWETARGADGAFTANDPATRQWAIDRAKRCVDVGRALGTDLLVLWLAREGTYVREAKSAIDAHKHLVDAINAILEYDDKVRIAIEPKPNEPMDHAFIPSIGHALAIAHQTADPARVGGLIETAHSQLAGFDASDDMAFALQAGKLWSVHLNDQNGLKYDQDKSFGSANLRAAFNQVRVLEEAKYPETGGMVAFDVKAMRTQPAELATKHLTNSRRIFLHLLDKVRTWDRSVEQQCIAACDYESLEMAVMEHLMGV